MITEEIRKRLNELKDEEYAVFQAKLIPSADTSKVIGVRTPQLRSLAKEFSKREDIGEFLADVPHGYFDEDQLHAFIISLTKDHELALRQVSDFLPYVDNWATCDQMSPKVFGKNKPALIPKINEWVASDKTYTVRFGIKMLMEHFLGDEFDPVYPETVANIRSDEYYVNMMIAWYFATALAKRYDETIPFIENKRLDKWTHNKAIQKSIESYRVSDEHKEYLRSLKIK